MLEYTCCLARVQLCFRSAFWFGVVSVILLLLFWHCIMYWTKPDVLEVLWLMLLNVTNYLELFGMLFWMYILGHWLLGELFTLSFPSSRDYRIKANHLQSSVLSTLQLSVPFSLQYRSIFSIVQSSPQPRSSDSLPSASYLSSSSHVRVTTLTLPHTLQRRQV